MFRKQGADGTFRFIGSTVTFTYWWQVIRGSAACFIKFILSTKQGADITQFYRKYRNNYKTKESV